MKKGQEEAPIEVLIGVTVLTFVLIIALGVFQESCSSQYEQKMRASFSKFARDLEFVYLGSVDTSFLTQVDFTQPSGCPGVSLHSINLLEGLPSTCLARIGRGDCMQLVAYLEPEQGMPVGSSRPILLTEVIDIPSDIKVTANFEGCPPNQNLVAIHYGEDLCSLKPSYNIFRLTKVANNEIEISDSIA